MNEKGEAKAQETLDMLKRQILRLRVRGDAKLQMEALKLAEILKQAVNAVDFWRERAAKLQERLERERKYGYKEQGRHLDSTEIAGISERIVIARRRRGMSQCALSRALHRSQSTVCKYESGKQIPSSETIRRMAVVLGCTEDWLLGRKKEDAVKEEKEC